MRDALPRIDLDIHNTWQRREELLEYLPQRWRDTVSAAPENTAMLRASNLHLPTAYGVTERIDSLPESGVPGSDYAFMRDQHLDPMRIAKGVLTFNIGQEAGIANVELAVELARAANRWSADRWLEVDDRLYGAVLVPTQDPQAGADEIRRWAGHRKIADVLVHITGVGAALGHPAYHPIYDAAAEAGLPVAIHIGGDIGLPGTRTSLSASGLPSSRWERHSHQMHPVQHYLLSFIVHGVFEKFPATRLVLKETGIAWLPWLIAELDAAEDMLRAESRWVRRRPSEYIRDHVLFTTHPLEHSPAKRQLVECLSEVDWIQDVLCYSSDYPHHDTDDADQIERLLPEEWLEAVFHDNAARVYGWVPEAVGDPVRAGA